MTNKVTVTTFVLVSLLVLQKFPLTLCNGTGQNSHIYEYISNALYFKLRSIKLISW